MIGEGAGQVFTVQVSIHMPVVTSNDCEGAGRYLLYRSVIYVLFSLACKRFVVGVWLT